VTPNEVHQPPAGDKSLTKSALCAGRLDAGVMGSLCFINYFDEDLQRFYIELIKIEMRYLERRTSLLAAIEDYDKYKNWIEESQNNYDFIKYEDKALMPFNYFRTFLFFIQFVRRSFVQFGKRFVKFFFLFSLLCQ
jgi:hypothetical protein